MMEALTASVQRSGSSPVYRRHIYPSVGCLDLDDVGRLDVQKLVPPEKPYSAQLSWMVLKTIFREARTHGVMENNPTTEIKLPKRPEPKRRFVTWDQVDSLDWGKYNEQIRFLALHGLRWSEAAVLTEEDFQDGYV